MGALMAKPGPWFPGLRESPLGSRELSCVQQLVGHGMGLSEME